MSTPGLRSNPLAAFLAARLLAAFLCLHFVYPPSSRLERPSKLASALARARMLEGVEREKYRLSGIPVARPVNEN